MKKKQQKIKQKSKKTDIKSEQKESKNKITQFVIITGIFIIVFALLIIFKNRLLPPSDTPTTLSTLNSEYIIVKDKDGKREYKLPLKPAMAKSLGFPAPPITSAATITKNVILNPIETKVESKNRLSMTTSSEEKDFSYLFKPATSKETIRRIDIDEAKFLFDSGRAIFIDSRALNEYEEAHIKGAIPIPTNMMMENIEKYKDKIKNKVLVTYCHGIGCHLADKVAYTLFDNGYKMICIFFSGWPKWNEHKYPITKKNQ